MVRKWYVSIALKCKVSYLRRQVSYLPLISAQRVAFDKSTGAYSGEYT